MKLLIFTIFLIIPSFIFAQKKQNHKYIGVQKCNLCHKGEKIGAQSKLWKKRKHSKSFKALLSEKGIKMAQAQGLGKASEAKECLTCHAPGALIDKKLLTKGFKIEDGVQCETCHGGGQDYRSMKIMKDHAKAVANGLKDFTIWATVKALCVKCHNGDEHTGKFNFEKAWEQVKHPVPGKK